MLRLPESTHACLLIHVTHVSLYPLFSKREKGKKGNCLCLSAWVLKHPLAGSQTDIMLRRMDQGKYPYPAFLFPLHGWPVLQSYCNGTVAPWCSWVPMPVSLSFSKAQMECLKHGCSARNTGEMEAFKKPSGGES